MTRTDLFSGLVLAAGFAAALWEAWSFQYGSEFAPGAGFAPVWLSAIGVAISLAIAIGGWRNARRSDSKGADSATSSAEQTDIAGLARVGATLIALFGMIAVTPWIGFVTAMLVFLLILTLFIQRLSAPVAVGASFATVAFVYTVFVHFLGVPIPAGPLGF